MNNTLNKIIGGVFAITLIGTGMVAKDLARKQREYSAAHANDLAYPNAVQFEDVQVIGNISPSGERSIVITEPNLRMKDYTPEGPFISSREYWTKGRFDEIRLYHVPKGSHLERFANVEKLEEAYSAYTNARASK